MHRIPPRAFGALEHDPVHRKYHQGQLTFSMVCAFQENFVLPLSHDEVVYGKGPLLGKMPGDDWQPFAKLRALPPPATRLLRHAPE